MFLAWLRLCKCYPPPCVFVIAVAAAHQSPIPFTSPLTPTSFHSLSPAKSPATTLLRFRPRKELEMEVTSLLAEVEQLREANARIVATADVQGLQATVTRLEDENSALRMAMDALRAERDDAVAQHEQCAVAAAGLQVCRFASTCYNVAVSCKALLALAVACCCSGHC